MSESVEKIRTFAIAGHTGCGKTSLCDLMLFKAKAVERLGSVDSKTSISDYTPDEQEKISSIYSAALNCSWNDYKFFFMDTPGYGEFIGETISSIAVSDSVLVVLDGIKGLEIGSSKAWKLAKDRSLPRFILINRLDKEMSDFKNVLSEIQEAYGANLCVPITIPVGKEAGLSRVVNVLKDKDVPAEIAGEVNSCREKLMDAIAESDEELMVRYLEGGQLTEEEISKGLHKAISEGKIVPVFAGSVAKDIGITELMDAIVSLCPEPLARKQISLVEGKTVEISESGPGIALVFKTILDPFIGQLNFFRVYSGKFSSETEIFNATTEEKEKFGPLLVMNGKNQTNIKDALPGYIVAVAKLKKTHISDTLVSGAFRGRIEPISFPNPVMSYAVTAAKSGEEEKISAGLSKISESDPTIKSARHPETKELLLNGMGDQHINQTIKKLRNLSKVEVVLNPPKIPYRETITSSGEGHYKHKKQTGGHGQFAEVYLKVSASPTGFQFNNDVVGGSIPRNFIPAVEKGVNECLIKGPLAGCHVENVAVSVYDGKHHDVDSSEMAFKIASRRAFRDAMTKAHPILLEPIQKVRIHVPDEHMGDITGDLNHKRGRILGMGVEDGMQVVNAEVPLAEMSKYANELRSITQGAGSFEMEFARYEMVPGNVSKTIIESYKSAEDEE